ncbi:MFS transporter [Actinocrispum wychmicini]|uniref:Multidrug resistance protein n=1 Tax=Actinocrispum wychmicini TaxID=1213861 RepID=A0A4V2S829_9PSEU|nr:MFS transporter [Actinocrispum wychmicini]TCO62240.1 multidrug resistance protein [Actinocrispum wychmicini]
MTAKPAVAAVCVAMFVDSLLYSVVVPVLPGYASRLGASSTAIGLLFAAYAVGLVLATPVLGRMSDRIGRRIPMLLGSVGLAATTVLYAFADVYPLLVTARFLQGVAAAAVWTAGIALVADVTEKGRLGQVMGVVMACMSAGLISGPPIGGFLEQAGGYRTPFLVVAAVAVLSGLTQMVLVKDPPATNAEGVPVRTLLADRSLRGTVIAVFLGASALSMLEPILPLDLADHQGAGPAAVGLVFGVATLANGAASPVIGALADRCRRVRLIALGLVASGGLLPCLLIPDSVVGTGAVLTVFAIAYGFILVPALPELATVAQRHGGGAYATVYAVFNISYSMGMVLGPVAGGAGAGLSLGATLAVAGALLCAGGLLLLAGTTGGSGETGAMAPSAKGMTR